MSGDPCCRRNAGCASFALTFGFNVIHPSRLPPQFADAPEGWDDPISSARPLAQFGKVGSLLAVFRPVEYLKVVAVIVSKCTDLSLSDDMRDAALEEIIEERRQAALLQIEKMREEDTRAAWPYEHD
jgi:hypothetical protein